MLACALHVRIYRVLLTIFTFSHGLVDLTMVLYTSSDSVSGWFPSPADRGFRPNVITYWALMAPECLDRTLIGAQRGPLSNQNINYQYTKLSNQTRKERASCAAFVAPLLWHPRHTYAWYLALWFPINAECRYSGNRKGAYTHILLSTTIINCHYSKKQQSASLSDRQMDRDQQKKNGFLALPENS